MRDIDRVVNNLIKQTIAHRINWQAAHFLNDAYQAKFEGMQITIGEPDMFLIFTTFMRISYPLVSCATYRNFKITRLYFVIRKYLKPVRQREKREETRWQEETLKMLAGS